MKALWITGILFAFVMLVVPAMAITTATLYAGQNIPVGKVEVFDDPSDPRIVFTTQFGWEMTETHLAVANDFTEIPQKNGNPIPGQFEYSTVHDPPQRSFTYRLEDPSWWSKDEFIVAAHAVVVQPVKKTMNVASSTNTRVVEVNGAPSTDNAVAANEPFSYPACSNTPSDDSKSWWDDGIGYHYDGFAAVGADWIWSTPDPHDPIEGEVVKFQEKFTIPGYPIKAGIWITADSGYLAMLNGVNLDPTQPGAQLGPGFPTTLKEDIGYGPQVGDWGVASQGWQSVEEPRILNLLVKGENTLDITAANEYMWDEAGTYDGPDYSLQPDGSAVLDIDPMTDSSGNSICGNPAGLIYRIQILYNAVDDVPTETAWADGQPFEGKNWATYFAYRNEN